MLELTWSITIYRKKKINIPPPSPSPLQSWSSVLVLVSWWIGSILTSTGPSSWPPDFLLTRITNNQLNGLRLKRTGITFEIVLTKQESLSQSGQSAPVSVFSVSERPRESSQLSQSISCLRYFSWLARMEQQSWSSDTAAILSSPPLPPPPSLQDRCSFSD